jgi:hypothetical protein
MLIATNKPVTITPKSNAPRHSKADVWSATNKMTKYTTIGDKTGSIEGIIISTIPGGN